MRASLLSVFVCVFVFSLVGAAPGQQKTWAPGEKELQTRYRELSQQGKYREAIPVVQQWVELCEEHHGAESRDTAAAVNNLALLYHRVGNYREAEAAFKRALEVFEVAFGPDEAATGQVVHNFGGLYLRLGRNEEAERLLKRALTIKEEKMGKSHASTALTVSALASAYGKLDRLVEAEEYAKRAVEIEEGVHGADAPATAISVNNLAGIQQSLGRYDESRANFERSVQIFETKLGASHPTTAGAIGNLANLYKEMARFDEAEQLLNRALKIYGETLGPNHPSTAEAMTRLASLHHQAARFVEADKLYQQALQIAEAAYEGKHPTIAVILGDLASLYHDEGRLEEAERYYEEALEMQETLFGPRHTAVAGALNNLATFHADLGRYEEAESSHRRALQIKEAVLGKEHDSVALTLNNLAIVYKNLDRMPAAFRVLQRSLAIREAIHGPNHPEAATAAGNLASLLKDLRRYEEAEEYFKRSLEVFKKTNGLNHPDTATSLGNLANLYRDTGRFEEAEALHKQALEIVEALHGPDHMSTMLAVGNLVSLYQIQGRREEALEWARREQEIRNSLLEEVLSFTTEKERLDFQERRQAANGYERFASLEAAEETARAVFRHKGIVLESLLEDRRAAAAGRGDPESANLLESIRAAKTQLLAAQLNKKTGRARISELQGQLRELQKDLASKVSRVLGSRESLSLQVADVRAAIPQNAALIEYFYFRRHIEEQRGEFSYGAIVLRPNSEPALVICGAAEEIDKQIAAYRGGVVMMSAPQLEAAGQALFQSLIAPLAGHLGNANTLIISPDAQLNFLPFAAILSKSDRFLAEDFNIRYIAGGRDLLKTRDSVATAPGPSIFVGDPKYFDETEPGSFGTGIHLSQLPGAREEATRVVAALGLDDAERRILVGAEATEQVIRNSRAPRVLHLATHGFFLDKVDLPGARAVAGSAENPMYRGGIALFGAQNTFGRWRAGAAADPDSDGVLMAAEVAEMDLDGTDLVALSACSTALGEAKRGEGVFGLRRGVVMSGARNLLMTMWPVADKETADFMEDFYARYAESGDAPTALAEVQRVWLIRLRKENDSAFAVHRAGAFIMSSQGGGPD